LFFIDTVEKNWIDHIYIRSATKLTLPKEAILSVFAEGIIRCLSFLKNKFVLASYLTCEKTKIMIEKIRIIAGKTFLIITI